MNPYKSCLKLILLVAERIKALWVILGLVLLFLVFLEGALSAIASFRRHILPSRPAYIWSAGVFTNESLTAAYLKEFNETQVRWEPYVYSRRKPYRGLYINVNADGLRVMPAPANEPGTTDHAITIFTFGGSTLWGQGARDSFTIPALLTGELKKRRVFANVINFGQGGYVSTQGMIALIRELQKGNVPDLVIFYDGVNDTFSAYQSGIAGIPQNEVNREREFNLLKPERLKQAAKPLAAKVINDLATMRLAARVAASLGLRKEIGALSGIDVIVRRSATDEVRLADEVASVYIKNTDLVRALGAFYGFKSIFYWQPTIYQKNELTADEKRVRLCNVELKRFYIEVYEQMEKKRKATDVSMNIVNMSGIFATCKENLFLDFCHLGERGNAIIAESMVTNVISIIQSR